MNYFRERSAALKEAVGPRTRGPKPKNKKDTSVHSPDGNRARCALAYFPYCRKGKRFIDERRTDWERWALCKKCGVRLQDEEPLHSRPLYWHPKGGCGAGPVEASTAIPFRRKGYRRARRRGAKQASKYRG